MSGVKYQLMPPLSTDEYADLEASDLQRFIASRTVTAGRVGV